MTGKDTDVVPQPRREQVPPRSRPPVVLAVMAVEGAALAVLAGLDTAPVLAVIVLVAGLFLLIWGAVALVRAVPGWWRLLAIVVALAVLQFVLLPLTEAVYATNVPPGPLGTGTPARYGLTYQDVAFRTADGVRLSAWYIPARNGAAVVLLPEHRGAGPARVRGAAGRWPRPRAVRRTRDGLRLVG